MSSVFPDPWRELGEFIREQRSVARLSVRRLSDMAGISNPYLSQIERGLRRPSAEILQQIAKALQLSAETLYVRAGILDPREFEGDLTEAILGEPSLTEEQKHTLLHIYASFRRDNTAPSDRDRSSGAAGQSVPPPEPPVGSAAVRAAGAGGDTA
jgi:transcriptional regulator with XRE-family HTH domain